MNGEIISSPIIPMLAPFSTASERCLRARIYFGGQLRTLR